MKKLLLILVVLTAVLCVAVPGQAETINLSQHITNPNFDMPFTPDGAIAEYPYKVMDNRAVLSGPSETGWYTTTGGCFYVHPQAPLTEGWEHSPENMVVMETFGATISMLNTGLVDINDGDVVEFSFQYRIGLDNASAPATLGVLMYNGGYIDGVYMTIPGSSMTREWQQFNFSLTHSGPTIPAGSYVMALDMFWDSGVGGYQQIYVDTFSSEDPTHAWNPNPKDGENNVVQEEVLTWNAPTEVATVTYDVYLLKGDKDPNTDPNFVGAAVATGITVTSYDPDPDLDAESEYYWRVDVHGMVEDPNAVNDPNYDPNNPVYDYPIDVTGNVWVFNTAGTASNPIPMDTATEVHPSAILEWDGLVGYKQDVYFGTDSAAVEAADINTVGIYQGRQDAAVTTFDPYDVDWMDWSTTYYWRIDEVDESTEPDTIIPGTLWSFTTVVPVCGIPLPIDVNGNCMVDLEEIAILAEMWLKCYWIPEESCP